VAVAAGLVAVQPDIELQYGGGAAHQGGASRALRQVGHNGQGATGLELKQGPDAAQRSGKGLHHCSSC
jgi:hypothetical protein